MQTYAQKAFIEGGANYEVIPWFQMFVNRVGESTASVLLESAGIVEKEKK